MARSDMASMTDPTPREQAIPTCKECGCQTGGGEYCYRHAPYTVQPLKDGSFRSTRNGLQHIWWDEPPSRESEAAVQAPREQAIRERLAYARKRPEAMLVYDDIEHLLALLDQLRAASNGDIRRRTKAPRAWVTFIENVANDRVTGKDARLEATRLILEYALRNTPKEAK